MKTMCSICARGGSKGVVNKNVRMIAGKPLLAHSILQAKAAGIFECISVSSDSEEILNIAREYGADYIIKRPDVLASDTAAKIPVIQHAALETEKMSGKKFDIFVDIDATSPLRLPEDIIACVNLLIEKKAENVITAMHSRRSPYFNLIEKHPDGWGSSKKLKEAIVRRQDAPQTYDMNASIYVWNRKALLEAGTVFLPTTELYVMPEERSFDIDSEFDFELVKYFLEKRNV